MEEHTEEENNKKINISINENSQKLREDITLKLLLPKYEQMETTAMALSPRNLTLHVSRILKPLALLVVGTWINRVKQHSAGSFERSSETRHG